MACKFAMSSPGLGLRTIKTGLFAFAFCIVSEAAAQSAAAPPAAADALTPAAPTTSAPTAEECLTAHREAQALRRQYRLLESRDQLLACGNSACPGPVKRDCLRWLDEVALQIASVVVHVDTGDSSPPHDVKVYIDGNLRFESIPNRAIELNPGTYRFRFEVEGRQPVELEVTVEEAEKFKNVTVKYSAPEKNPNGLSGGSSNSSSRSPISVSFAPSSKGPERPVPTATYIFAGLGAAAAINFAFWGISAQSLKGELEDKCAPNCEQVYIDRIRTRALVADISLGISVASFATAAITYFARPQAQSTQPLDVGFGVLPGGGLVGQLRVSNF